MPALYPEIKKLTGLYLQQNSFTVPDGACEVANNITISSDNVLSPRRGNYNYFTPVSGTFNRLFNYQEKLIAAYSTKLRYYTDTGSSPNEKGTEHTISGETVAITSGRVSRSVEANNNFYFTTDNSPLKLTAYNSAILKSGAPQGLDVNTVFITGLSTILGSDQVTGYRVLYGYLDDNDNLILGAPSSVVTITNRKITGAAASASGTTITVTEVAHGLVTGMNLIFTDAAGFTTSANANGTYAITVTGADTFTYVVAVTPTGAGTLSYCHASPVRLEGSIPSEISTALPWFVQVYRASAQDYLVGIQGDYKLVVQQPLTAAQITAGLFFYTDTIPENALGAELYTNENSREGELQANFRAPLCEDTTYYKGYVIYGNCTTRQAIALASIDPTLMVSTDYVEIKITSTTRRYVARTGAGNKTLNASVSNAAGNLQINATAHNLGLGYTVYIANVAGGTLAAGTYYIKSLTADNFQISLTNGGTAITYNSETSLTFEGVTDGTYYIFELNNSGSSNPSVRLADTAQGLVKAINRDPSSLVYAQYTSSPISTPGQMFFQAKGFGDAIYIRANSTAAGTAFYPNLPDSFASGTQVYSRDDLLPHAFFASKYNEPEAVPILNFFLVGAKNKPLLRVIALRDSIIVLKEDGVYRVTGDSLANFTITPLDKTVICLAASSATVINNNVIFLSNQGVCLVTESTVQIISRQIEDVIQPILGQPNLATYTSGVAYETARLYILTTTTPNDSTASQVYCYNILTDSWTTWDTLFTQAAIGPNDNLYFINSLNNIQKERKKQTKIDFCDQNLAITVNTVSGLTIGITSNDGIPEKGDVIVKNDVINRITNVVTVNSVQYLVTIQALGNLVAADSLWLYSSYTQTIKFSPFHAGLVGREKQYSQFQIHFRDDNCSKLTIYFTGDTFGSSDFTTWQSQLTSAGWGQFPWGMEGWGEQETINLTQGTRRAPICRIYIPLFQQRTTFIQPVITHQEAAEPMAMQAVSYAVRAYAERVSK